MKLYSYVIAQDYGFAPNPFFGMCTLATCKPGIRRCASVGDYIVGTGCKKRNRSGYLVYVMRVDDALCFCEYWEDPRFQVKRPNLRGSKKQAFGDNIYHRDPATGEWLQANSYHSLPDGPNPRNVENDTKSTRVLVGSVFVFWGGGGPLIPSEFRDFDGEDICCGRGYRCHFPEPMVTAFIAWINSLGERGCVGRPLDWDRTA